MLSCRVLPGMLSCRVLSGMLCRVLPGMLSCRVLSGMLSCRAISGMFGIPKHGKYYSHSFTAFKKAKQNERFRTTVATVDRDVVGDIPHFLQKNIAYSSCMNFSKLPLPRNPHP